MNNLTSQRVLEHDGALKVLGRPPRGLDEGLAVLVDVRDGVVDALAARHVVGVLALEGAHLEGRTGIEIASS